MSLDATRWAWMQKGIRPMHKLVLLSLADRADAEDIAFPSNAALESDTGMDLKTIWAALKSLADLGVIEDTKERVGRTRQTKVWRLIGVEHRIDQSQTYNAEQKRKDSKSGSLPKTEAFRKQHRNTSVFGYEPPPKTEVGIYQ